ncbi:MAG: bifunctional diaminohydroxyphosphoribosylaminopyrimidine deaminase/5-amino-6-(5-phosphoribosylamino)uracil reductase RibD [Kiritimatiellae bacterium]|jgi:diaminohydroxyphosphoribosylaminopyrimidine deaminase/5-amino-6-(5-phosphoribosylamino)uracil reductase|nr:bifunctional diaminohydroxyphosphoribosylaminopyrimidine deaminase/5-amino-6-(5-phosphoribosylamino)uracil reductase RibD [Kiritimatiellia bacterium]
MSKFALDDQKWMQRAIELAHLSEGYTRPNPPVGAVIVKEGRVIGEGRHECVGYDHAEAAAIKACTESAEGATIYVTLEPCSTYGRTPPCTERIIKAGIKRVVIGCQDSFEQHCGEGNRILTANGIEVLSDVCADECCDLATPFFKHVVTKLPYLTLKIGMTLDGCIADRNSCSQWITGEAARAEVQRIRRRADAMLVGSQTICADNPSLLSRIGGGERLLRIVIDSKGIIPASAQVLTDSAADRTFVFSSQSVSEDKVAAWTRNGASVLRLDVDEDGRLPLTSVMQTLGEMDLMHVVCEGGGGLAGALHNAGLIDEYCLFYAPAVLGDTGAKRGFVCDDVQTLHDMRRMKIRDVRMIGNDICVRMLKG